MIDARTKVDVRAKTLELFEKAHIVLTDKEKENIEYDVLTDETMVRVEK